MDSVEFMLDAIRRINANDRYYSYDSMWKTCSIVEEMMRDLGMTEVRTYAFPSDGVTDHAGWVMPLGWNPKKGILNLVSEDGREEKICSYDEVPCSLMLYSRSGEVTAELALPEEEDLHGKIVLLHDRSLSMESTFELISRGAAGILCSFLATPCKNSPGFEHLNDACQWCNFSLPFWQTESEPWGFSLTPNQGRRLLDLKKKNQKVLLHASIEVEMKPGKIPQISGLLPGETNEEIVLTGHLFEEGANDNGSGVAAALTIVRKLAGQKRKRGIRLLFTHECRSMQAYVNTLPKHPDFVAGLVLDMIGFTLDNVAWIADGAPSCPSYATPLIRHFLLKHGFNIKVIGITGNDQTLAEPSFGAAVSGVEILADPCYHSSLDTPDHIDPECLKRCYEATLEFTFLLINAGSEEAEEIAAITADYDREVSFLNCSPAMAQKIAEKRLKTVLRLVPEAEREEFRKTISALTPSGEAADTVRMCGELEKMIPVKKFRGFFSFERFWLRDTYAKHSHLKSLFNGWSASAWVDHALAWADGTRNGEEIWNMLLQSGYRVDAKTFADLLLFLAKEKYIALK